MTSGQWKSTQARAIWSLHWSDLSYRMNLGWASSPTLMCALTGCSMKGQNERCQQVHMIGGNSSWAADAEGIWCFRKTNQNADLSRFEWAAVSLLEPKCKCRVWSACKWCLVSFWRPPWKTNGVYQPVSAVWPGCHLISFFLKVVFISIHHCCCYIN